MKTAVGLSCGRPNQAGGSTFDGSRGPRFLAGRIEDLATPVSTACVADTGIRGRMPGRLVFLFVVAEGFETESPSAVVSNIAFNCGSSVLMCVTAAASRQRQWCKHWVSRWPRAGLQFCYGDTDRQWAVCECAPPRCEMSLSALPVSMVSPFIARSPSETMPMSRLLRFSTGRRRTRRSPML